MPSSNKKLKKKNNSLKERIAEEEIYYQQKAHPEDKKIKKIALLAAIVIHVLVFSIKFPTYTKPLIPDEPEQAPRPIYEPPLLPPEIKKPEPLAPKELHLRLPVPDPTPDDPEPIQEPRPAYSSFEDIPISNGFLELGDPEAPPQLEPQIPGVGSVTFPERIPESYVAPLYPDLPRKARIEGDVILRIIVRKDGMVGDIVILSSSSPNLGFEEAAINAVKQWRYKPATQRGIPVDVYLTVQIIFELNN